MNNNITAETLFQRNKELAATHQPLPTISGIITAGGELPKFLVLTCADPRCDPKNFLGIQPTDGIVVVRNVCGHVAPALNTIIALDVLLTLSGIMIVHHTDCGSLQFTDEAVKEVLRARVPGNAEIDDMKFGAIIDVPQSVKDDLDFLKASPLIREELKERASGYVFDIESGLLAHV